MQPKISIIIPVYQTEKYLSECLDSVLAQTFQDWEAVCVNDGSPDGSQNILEKYARRDNRIIIVRQENSGVIAARNNGIAIAQGEYLFPLDSDDVIAPDCLEKLYIKAGVNRVVAPRVMRFGRQSGEMVLPKISKYNMLKCNCLVNAALFSKKLIEQFGGYDPQFSKAIEDYDLWLNFIFHGVEFVRAKDAWFHYRIKDKEESRNLRSSENQCAMYQLVNKKYPQVRRYRLMCRVGHFLFNIKKTRRVSLIRVMKIPIMAFPRF